MKITPEISARVGKNRYFWKPDTCNIFGIYPGVNKVIVVGTGSLQESVYFSIFSHIFFFTFPTSRYFRTLNKQKFVFGYAVSVFSGHTRTIAGRAKC